MSSHEDQSTKSSKQDMESLAESLLKNMEDMFETSAKMSVIDLQTLAAMNASSFMFYKNMSDRVASLANSVDSVRAKSELTEVPSAEVDKIWLRTLQLEGVVNALDAYSAKLEARLAHPQRPKP